ncbi:MAG: haloacid dehalogenase type II [Chloroflexia bacterium]|nr:haloacid dehalogenase type II [Chloroflexia bacterium]
MDPRTLSFDVYGTLVDPLGMTTHLQETVGEQADRFAALWREKQIEYTFRRGLMRRYEDFNVCTRQAMQYVALALDVDLSQADQDRLLEAYQQLDVFPETIPALQELKEEGHSLVAFSNGVEATLRKLLESNNILGYLDDVVSVDDLQTFKPGPDVYRYLSERVGRSPAETWLVSSNAWDVIGAKAAGLRAIWVGRNQGTVYDPWGIEPDLVITDLHELAATHRS